VGVAAELRDRRAEEIVGASGPPWRTWVVVLATAGLLVGYLVAHRRPGAEPPSPAPEVVAPTLAPGGGSVSGNRIGPGPPGLRLLVGGSSPRLVDAATGGSSFLDVPGAGARAPAWLVPTGRAVAAFVTPPSFGPRAPGHAVGARVGFLVRAGLPAVPLGAADGGVAARGGGVITLLRTPAGSVLTGFGPDGARRWQRRVPAGIEPRADTRYGLLVQVADSSVAGQFGALQLVDPVTGRLRREVAHRASTVLAVRDDAVAWLGAGGCPPDCAVRVTDLGTGRTWTVGVRLRHVPVGGAFSPDGRWLALTFETSWPADGVSRYPDGLVGLVDLGTGSVTAVRGYGGGLYPPAWVDWSRDGRLVVMLTAQSGRERIRIAVAQHAGRPGAFILLPWSSFYANASLGVAP
jgi:hypothetical protein